MIAPPLSPELAASHRRRLAEEHFDVLVVGGGVVGAGVALDAAARGLTVGLVEAEDFASGTSSRSSKLIHGGLRYIQALQFGLVREALRERSILLEIAPHLVRPASFLYPLRHHWERPYVGAGVGLYDTLARLSRTGTRLPAGRHLGRRATLELAPALRDEHLRGSVLYKDAQVDDARYVLALIRTAVARGAVVANRARVTAFVEERGRVVGAATQFSGANETATVRAKVTVVAAGAGTGSLVRSAGPSSLNLRPSKGVHLVVPREAIDAACALIVPTSRSVLFVLPWGAHWLVGTTDTPWQLAPSPPVANRGDIDYLLNELNALVSAPVRAGDIESIYVGLRPLVGGTAADTPRLSREHSVVTDRPGLVAVTGGKFTTYRVMAKDALDTALGRDAPASTTEQVPVIGAEGYESARRDCGAPAKAAGIPPATVERLLGRYGALTPELLSSGEPGDLQPVPNTGGYLRAEFRYGVSHEGARHLEDLLVRRTRTAMETRDRGVAAATEVARWVAPLLGWDHATRTSEVAAYREFVAAQLRAELAEDDISALAAASGATRPTA